MNRQIPTQTEPTLDVGHPGVPTGDEEVAPGNEWPALRLGDMPPAEPFPIDVLPGPVANFVRVTSDAIGCPPDFAAVPILVVGGAANGRSVMLQLKPGYKVSSALYAMTVGGPSSGKSPAFAAAVRPLQDINARLMEEFRILMAHFTEEMEAYRGAQPDSKPPLPTKPVPEAALVEDATKESLAYLLAQNPRGLCMSLDEGSSLIASLGQYKNGKGADRQFFLSALYGAMIRQDRRGRPDEPTIVPEPFLSILGNIPPDMLATFREGQGRQDGFLERLLLACPEPRPKPLWSDYGIPDEVAKSWASIVGRLRSRPMRTNESWPQSHIISFDDEAKAVWVDWYNGHVALMNSGSPDAGDPASEWKLCDFTGRLALILHLLYVAADPATKPTDAIPPVSLRAVEGAIRLWSYFRSHQKRVRSAMAGRGFAGAPRLARLILGWIKNDPERSTFKQGDLSRCYAPSRGYDPEEMEDALNWLAGRHCIRPVMPASKPRGKRGRTPSQAWEVHPDLPRLQVDQGNPGSASVESINDPDLPEWPDVLDGPDPWESDWTSDETHEAAE